MNKKKMLMPLFAFFPLLGLVGCGGTSNKVVIYTALEDYRIAMFQEELNKKFTDTDIIIQSLSSGTLVSRLLSEGQRTSADIIVNLEVANAEMVLAKDNNVFADLSDYDTSKYLDEMLTYQERHHKYHIQDREAGCVILNTKVLKEKNLAEPTCYADLLKPEYQGLVIMPNPKSSGTGYYFYKNITSVMGIDDGLNYFENLSKNVKEFTTSGSGPVKSCDRGETAIGLGMTFQAAKYVGENPDLKIKYFDEGSPYSLFTMTMINGKQTNPKVKEVYDYIFDYVNVRDKALFAPDAIYKPEYQPEIELENFPTDIKYADMGDMYDYELKQSLLDQWKW